MPMNSKFSTLLTNLKNKFLGHDNSFPVGLLANNGINLLLAFLMIAK